MYLAQLVVLPDGSVALPERSEAQVDAVVTVTSRVSPAGRVTSQVYDPVPELVSVHRVVVVVTVVISSSVIVPVWSAPASGASLVLATVMVNVSVTEAPAASVAVITTELEPTSPLAGVPASTPVDAVKVAQLGTVVPARVTVSPLSTSAAVTV